MELKLLERRAEMLDAVSNGLHPAAVVGQLAEKYGVSERALWSDWERRAKWVPVLLGLEKYAGFVEVVEQKLNAVQKLRLPILRKTNTKKAKMAYKYSKHLNF